MKKYGILSLLLIGMFIFSLSSVSAEMTFDNVKSYNPETKTAVIENLFGLGEDIAEVQLLSPLNVKVPRGYNQVAEFRAVGFEDYKDFVKELEFLDLKKNEKKISREFDLMLKGYENISVDDYEYKIIDYYLNGTAIYGAEKVGSHIEEKVTWTKLNPADLKKNEEVIIGIFTDVQPGDKVDWIPNFAGVKIKEWATWEESLEVGLTGYLSFDNIDGDTIIDYTGNKNGTRTGSDVDLEVTGHLGDCVNGTNFLPGNYVDITADSWRLTDDGSICFWIWMPSEPIPGGEWTYGEWGGNVLLDQCGPGSGCSAENVGRMRAVSSGAAAQMIGTTYLNTSTWNHICFTRNVASNNASLYVNGIIEAGSTATSSPSFTAQTLELMVGDPANANSTKMAIDEFGMWNRTLSASEVATLYASGEGMSPKAGPESGLFLNLSSPENNYNQSSLNEIEFNITATDNLKIENVTLYIDGVLNETNSSQYNGTYIFNKILSEGEHNWSVLIFDNESFSKQSATRILTIDVTLPLINSISINDSGTLFGYPKMFLFENNETDTHLSNCWYNTDYNSSNISFTCNENISINAIPEGSRQITIYVNDSFGWENSSSLDFSIDYYTHNVSYQDSFTSETLNPTCEFLGINHTGYNHAMDIHNTSSREVDCWLFGYATFNYNLTESNYTNQSVSVNPVMLNLTFDDTTNATITWLGGSLSFEDVTNITIPIRNISETGNIQVSFNEDTQLYSFYNDGNTPVNASLHLEVVDFDQPVKVLASSQEIKDALVVFYKDNKITYSAFTDINGIAHILINDGTTYEIHVSKEGYEDYEELKYIPTSNTDTIIINLISEEGSEGDYYFSSSCLNVIGTEKNCSFYVKSYRDANVTFNYTWWGSSYSVTSEGSEATLTLIANESTTPIYVTASVNPTKNYQVIWEALSSRSIQLEFDADEIKDENNGVLVLFYAIVLILGILMMVSVNRIKKMEGKGIWVMVGWFGIIALSFPLLWFIVTPSLIYAIFKTFWGNDD